MWRNNNANAVNPRTILISAAAMGAAALPLPLPAQDARTPTQPAITKAVDGAAAPAALPPRVPGRRYDPALDPRSSPQAAQNYYARREQMIIGFRGDRRIEDAVARVKSGQGTISELVTALGTIQGYEIARAVPFVAKLLDHPDASVQRTAIEVLCAFGDRRGFDFILAQRKKDAGFSDWHSLLVRVLTENQQTAHNGELREMMKLRSDPAMSELVAAYSTAQLLAQLGDDSGLPLIADVMRKYPPEGMESVLELAGLKGTLVKELAQELTRTAANDRVKQAAYVVLAAQGDAAARQQIIKAASRLTSLPQPQNADGTYKPGLKPTVIGGATPAWDGEATIALEHGMEAVAPVEAVPVLREIALHANNVRFSKTAIVLLAKMGDDPARLALQEVAQAAQLKRREFEGTLFNPLGKALMLFDDPASASLAEKMFHGDKYGMATSQFLAETRGWAGLFKLQISY